MIDVREAAGVPCITTARPAPPPPEFFEAVGIRPLPWQSAYMAYAYAVRRPGHIVVTGVGT